MTCAEFEDGGDRGYHGCFTIGDQFVSYQVLPLTIQQ